MQSRIYGFEIVRAVVNGVYEARDTDNNSSVMLYEWTPAIADRDAAKLRLSELQEQVSGKAFSADASLYLVAISTQEGDGLLKVLQSHNLFTGVTSGGAPSPTPPPPPPAKRIDEPVVVVPEPTKTTTPPPPPAAKTEPASSSGRVWAAVIAVIICSVVAFAIGNSVGQDTASSAAARRSNEASSQASQDLSAAQSQSSDLQGKLSAAQGQLKNFEGIQTLRMTNKTTETVHVAVMYKNWSGVWVLAGWQVLAPSATALVATSPNGVFYYTAYSDALVWQGKNDAETYHTTKTNFVYYPDLQTAPADWETMKLIEVHGGNMDLT